MNRLAIFSVGIGAMMASFVVAADPQFIVDFNGEQPVSIDETLIIEFMEAQPVTVEETLDVNVTNETLDVIVTNTSQDVSVLNEVDVNITNSLREQIEIVAGNIPVSTCEVLYTVPENMRLVITDAMFRPNVVTVAEGSLRTPNVRRAAVGNGCPGGLLFAPFVKGVQHIDLHFQTGFEFEEGESLVVAVAGGSDGLAMSFVGYLTPQ